MGLLLSLLKGKEEAGFTLLETVIYIALFGLVVGSIVTFGYAITQGIAEQGAKLETQEQANFVIDKINWLLDTNQVNSPAPGAVTGQLILSGTGGNNQVNELDGRLQLQSSNNSLPLTPITSKLENFNARQDTSQVLTIEFQLNGQNFSFSRSLVAGP